MEVRVELRMEARTKGGEGTRRESEGARERESTSYGSGWLATVPSPSKSKPPFSSSMST